jgi:hypothetical protein
MLANADENLQKEHIQILLQAGSQLLSNNDGHTPASLAQAINRSDIVELLGKEEIIQHTIPSLGILSKSKLVSYLLSLSNEAQKQAILYARLHDNLLAKNNIHIDTDFGCGYKLIHLATQVHNLPMIHSLL